MAGELGDEAPGDLRGEQGATTCAAEMSCSTGPSLSRNPLAPERFVVVLIKVEGWVEYVSRSGRQAAESL